MLESWVCEKPWVLKKEITESGLSGFSKWMRWEADDANSEESPHEFRR